MDVLGFRCKYYLSEGIKKSVELFTDEFERNPKKLLKKFEEDSKCEF